MEKAQQLVLAAVAASAVFVLWWSLKKRWEKPPQLAYGTAGFRADAKLLPVAMERVGIVAALRSVDREDATGVMVTASHNPVHDNGAKIVDSNGGMLAMSWESKAEAVACCSEAELQEVIAREFGSSKPGGVVVMGRDTRPHSAYLQRLAMRGAVRMGATVIDVGVVSTPQLHHCVLQHNKKQNAAALYGYTDRLADALARLLQGFKKRRSRLVVDCAGGVGALSVVAVTAAIEARIDGFLDIQVANAPGGAVLNDGCGAEFVQKQQRAPANVDLTASRVASLDGDADRLVYSYADEKGAFKLLDGDKIATLLASFIAEELTQAKLEKLEPSFGVVQTAYANGAAGLYIKSTLENVQVVLAKTGVKFVHHAAEAFDIGVYFEANGHGTVLFSEGFCKGIREACSSVVTTGLASRVVLARRRLLAMSDLANPVVGDAVADVLLVEAVLALQDRTVEDWDATYTELPSRQLKQRVQSRAAVQPNADESRLLEPRMLQEAIDTLVERASKSRPARAFVRPSGTEDVVRVYAEAGTAEAAEALARDVARLVYDLADGVGDRP